ncbi:MAG: hypothetical protein L0Z07_00845, partial [Planctomycetes bacterium]|nr:hypothetical protein [Planctomycetota bacterium]
MSISQQHDKHIWRVVLPARVGQIHSFGLALAAAMALMAVCEQVAHAQETIGDIQRKIVEYRSSIDHGKLQIKTLVQYPTLVPIEKEEITVDLYFRGEDVRADRHFL